LILSAISQAINRAENREESGAVLIDEEKEKTITTRQPLKLAEGYVLKINRIDVDRDNVYLDLLKGDEIVDSGIVSPNDPVGDNKIYRYTKDVGKSQAVALIEIHFKNAFHGAEQDIATISRVFQISESSFGDN